MALRRVVWRGVLEGGWEAGRQTGWQAQAGKQAGRQVLYACGQLRKTSTNGLTGRYSLLPLHLWLDVLRFCACSSTGATTMMTWPDRSLEPVQDLA